MELKEFNENETFLQKIQAYYENVINEKKKLHIGQLKTRGLHKDIKISQYDL